MSKRRKVAWDGDGDSGGEGAALAAARASAALAASAAASAPAPAPASSSSAAAPAGAGAGAASALRQSASPHLDATRLVWRHPARLAAALGNDCGLSCRCKAKLVLLVHAPLPVVWCWFAHDTLIAYTRARDDDERSSTRALAARLARVDGGRRAIDGVHAVREFITQQAALKHSRSAPWVAVLERKRRQPTMGDTRGEIPTWTGFAREAAGVAAALPAAWTGHSTIADARAVLAALEALPPPTPQHLVTRAQIEALGGSWADTQWWLHGSSYGKLVRRDRQAAGLDV